MVKLALFLLPLLCFGQWHPPRDGVMSVTGGLGIPRSGLELYLNLAGQDPSLNAGARPWTPAVNQLLSSEDLTATWTETGSGSIDDATHFTFVAQNDYVSQPVTTLAGVLYTVWLETKQVTGNTALHAFHYDAATGNQTSVTITGTSTGYAFTVLGKAGGGLVYFGIQDRNAAGHGQIEVTRWMLAVGTHTAAEMAALYEKTTDRQSIYDFSGNGNHGVPGGVAAPTTNDPTLSWESRNNCAPGSCKDLTDAAWTATDVTVNSALLATFTAQFGKVIQDVTTVEGVSYTLSFDARRISGNTGLAFRHESSATADFTAFTISDTTTRHSATFLGRVGGGAVGIGVQDRNAAGHGQIEITNWQVEIGSSASTFTDPAESGRPVMGFTTDDYVTADGLASGFSGEDVPFTFAVLAKVESLSSAARFLTMGSSVSDNPYLQLRANTTTGELNVAMRDDTGGGAISRTATETIDLSVWNVLVFSSTGTVLSGWIDGIQVTWDDTGVDVGTLSVDQVTLGALGRTTYSNFIEANLSHALLHSRGLSAGEAISLTHALARQACVQNGKANMCTVVNRTAPAYGWNWGGASWLLALNPAAHAEQRWIDVGRQLAAAERWERKHPEELN